MRRSVSTRALAMSAFALLLLATGGRLLSEVAWQNSDYGDGGRQPVLWYAIALVAVVAMAAAGMSWPRMDSSRRRIPRVASTISLLESVWLVAMPGAFIFFVVTFGLAIPLALGGDVAGFVGTVDALGLLELGAVGCLGGAALVAGLLLRPQEAAA